MPPELVIKSIVVSTIATLILYALLSWAGVPWLMRFVVSSVVVFLCGVEVARAHRRGKN